MRRKSTRRNKLCGLHRMLSAVFVWTLLLGMVLGVCGNSRVADAKQFEQRGVWVSCFDYETAGLKDQTEGSFRKNARKMYKTILANGCNTVYFHVRSFDDAIWPSATFGMSKYLVSESTITYDPMAILVEEAHKAGLSFHAWMNPYRVTYEKVLNPGAVASVKRIQLAVQEVLDRYPVDGIHFDDYFYPSGAHPQVKKFAKLTTNQKMAKVNAMIRKVYQQVKAKSEDLAFGISPPGELSYANSIGGDVKTWLSTEGYVDYIIPQIYWTNDYISKGRRVRQFDNCMTAWEEMNTLDIPMYAGLAIYRAKAVSSADPGWRKRSTNIASQVKTLSREGWTGYVLFSYLNLVNDTAVKERSNYRKAISTVKLTKKNVTLSIGATSKLKAITWPSAMSKKVSYKTSKRAVATVNAKGVVTARAIGKATITVSNAGGKKVTCKIIVK